ncbi:transposase [Pseudonocardia sp. HH130630-07]|uniref:transposase n=1 Tax=Pseudonocardia sp. HH130630-07 TaxID=1690815 RepID=UPI0009F236E6
MLPARVCLPYGCPDCRQDEPVSSSRFALLSDAQWQLIGPLLPSNAGRRGHPFGEDRRVVEGIIFRYRTGICGSPEIVEGSYAASRVRAAFS